MFYYIYASCPFYSISISSHGIRLARLGRIIRLLKFKIFQELKLMIQGVFTGLRVLFWAVVLFIGCMYLVGRCFLIIEHEWPGVVTRTLFGDFRVEFSSAGGPRLETLVESRAWGSPNILLT